MKKNCLIIVLLSYILISNAQIARWEMRPNYDTMYLPEGASFITTSDRLGSLHSLWSLDNYKLIRQVSGDIHPFHDSVAVNTDTRSAVFKGHLKNTGEYTTAPAGVYLIDPYFPYFSDGYLIVRETSGYYLFLNKKNTFAPYKYNKAFPFFNGYSSCEYNQDQVNMKNPVHCLVDNQMKIVKFTIQGKTVKKTDVDFVSSVNDEHIAIVIVNKKVYLFHSDTNELTPLCHKKESIHPKEQLKIPDKLEHCLIKGHRTWILKTECGKEEIVKIFFDGYLRTSTIRFTDGDQEYYDRTVKKPSLPTSLEIFLDDGGYGIKYKKKEVLASQFEKVTNRFDNRAIVRKNGKFGLVSILPDQNFSVKIYDKDAMIPFVHKELSTTIQVDIPPGIKADSVSIIKYDPEICEIDDNSWEAKKTRYANYIQYHCTLNLPKELFNRDTTEINFPIQINYDGLMSPEQVVKKRATIRKYWSVNVDKDSKRLRGDSLTFDFSLDYSGFQQRDYKYGVSVTILPENRCKKEKFNDTRYRCTVTNLTRGTNQIQIKVEEDGFPPSTFPISFDYKPPVAPTEESPEGSAAEVGTFEWDMRFNSGAAGVNR